MELNLNQNENVEHQFHSLKTSLEAQLDSWEHDTRVKTSGSSFEDLTAPPPLISADTAIKGENSSFKSNSNSKENIKTNQNFSSSNTQILESYQCPECNEPMYQKEGKRYFLCKKHWGYPNQIAQGIVKERKY